MANRVFYTTVPAGADGRPVPFASVAVNGRSVATPISVYADPTTVTAIPTPILTDATGRVQFWVENGTSYDVTLSGAALSTFTDHPEALSALYFLSTINSILATLSGGGLTAGTPIVTEAGTPIYGYAYLGDVGPQSQPGIVLAGDTDLYRLSAGNLKTDGNLVVAGSGGGLDLSGASGTTVASGTGLGDKIGLYTNSYGFGIQADRLVAYLAGGAAFAVRPVFGGGDRSGGSDVWYADYLGNTWQAGSSQIPGYLGVATPPNATYRLSVNGQIATTGSYNLLGAGGSALTPNTVFAAGMIAFPHLTVSTDATLNSGYTFLGSGQLFIKNLNGATGHMFETQTSIGGLQTFINYDGSINTISSVTATPIIAVAPIRATDGKAISPALTSVGLITATPGIRFGDGTVITSATGLGGGTTTPIAYSAPNKYATLGGGLSGLEVDSYLAVATPVNAAYNFIVNGSTNLNGAATVGTNIVVSGADGNGNSIVTAGAVAAPSGATQVRIGAVGPGGVSAITFGGGEAGSNLYRITAGGLQSDAYLGLATPPNAAYRLSVAGTVNIGTGSSGTLNLGDGTITKSTGQNFIFGSNVQTTGGGTVAIGNIGPSGASAVTFQGGEAGSNLYRAAAGALQSDGQLTATPIIAIGPIRLTDSKAISPALTALGLVTATPGIRFGDGTALTSANVAQGQLPSTLYATPIGIVSSMLPADVQYFDKNVGVSGLVTHSTPLYANGAAGSSALFANALITATPGVAFSDGTVVTSGYSTWTTFSLNGAQFRPGATATPSYRLVNGIEVLFKGSIYTAGGSTPFLGIPAAIRPPVQVAVSAPAMLGAGASLVITSTGNGFLSAVTATTYALDGLGYFLN